MNEPPQEFAREVGANRFDRLPNTLQEFLKSDSEVEIIQNILRSNNGCDKDFIFQEICYRFLDLACDENGRIIIETFIERGTAQEREIILADIRQNIPQLSIDKNGHIVVVKALKCMTLHRSNPGKLILDLIEDLRGGIHACEFRRNPCV